MPKWCYFLPLCYRDRLFYETVLVLFCSFLPTALTIWNINCILIRPTFPCLMRLRHSFKIPIPYGDLVYGTIDRRTARGQCVQIFFVKMRKILLKMREKMRQPKMSTFYFSFGRFRVGLLFKIFDLFIFLKKYILLHKIMKKSKMCHFLGFRALREIHKSMRERGSKCATFAQNHNIWTHCAWKNFL